MKILYVTPYFVPAWSYGGPVKVSYDFSKELIRLGNDVTVATTDVLDSSSRNKLLFEKIDGIKVFRFRNVSNTLAKKLNLYAPIGLIKWLKQNIQKYDIVHIHEFFTYQSIATGRLCRKLGKPYVIQPHGSFSQFARESRFRFIKKFFIKWFASLVKSSKAVIVLTDKEKKDTAIIFPQSKSKIKVVPNGIDMDEFKNIRTVDLHKVFDIPRENKIIAFIGRLHFQKGLDVSLEALALLKKECNFTFLIIGPDEGEKNNLEKLAKKLGIHDQIVFAGLISGIKKLQTLKSADLSLLNSRSEGLPTTLLESAALGLPIVCSRESNLAEVEKFGAGFITDNIKQTAESVKLILKNADLQHELSRNALKLADRFNLKRCAQILNKIYLSSL